jgi:hypothetical protein
VKVAGTVLTFIFVRYPHTAVIIFLLHTRMDVFTVDFDVLLCSQVMVLGVKSVEISDQCCSMSYSHVPLFACKNVSN